MRIGKQRKPHIDIEQRTHRDLPTLPQRRSDALTRHQRADVLGRDDLIARAHLSTRALATGNKLARLACSAAAWWVLNGLFLATVP